jgi:hypothetical protein
MSAMEMFTQSCTATFTSAKSVPSGFQNIFKQTEVSWILNLQHLMQYQEEGEGILNHNVASDETRCNQYSPEISN